MRKNAALFFALTVLATATFAQELAFEVATIHPAAPLDRQAILTGSMNLGVSVNGNQVSIRYLSLRDLAVQAYEVKPFDVKAPDWMAQQRYDITALLPEGATQKDLPQLLRSLLRDRFKMVAHTEGKETDVYALVQARDGHKMKPSPEVVPPPPADPNQPEADPAKATSPGLTVNGQRMSINQVNSGPSGGTVSITGGQNGAQRVTMGADGQMHLEIERMTMSELADQLTVFMDLPVQDRTELSGPFQVALDMSMGDLMGVMNRLGAAPGVAAQAQGRMAQLAATDPGGTIEASIQKLGLRLEKQKGSVKTLVIDSGEQTPTEN